MHAIDLIRDKLAGHPEINYSATESSVRIPPRSPEGFECAFYAHLHGFTVHFEGWHEEFQSESEALNCFAFGLSDTCRLKVSSIGARDHSWTLQSLHDGEWHDESTTALLLVPFWRAKEVRYLLNSYLKAVGALGDGASGGPTTPSHTASPPP